MSNSLTDSIKFLIKEYERLKKKKIKMQLSESEKETLKKLIKFLGRN